MSGAGGKQGGTEESPEQFPSIRRYLSRRWAPDGAKVMVLGDSMLDAYIVGSPPGPATTAFIGLEYLVPK